MSVETETAIDKFLVDGKGTIMTFTGGHPLDISKKPLDGWVKSLF